MNTKAFYSWLMIFVISLFIEFEFPHKGLGVGLFVLGNGLLALMSAKGIADKFKRAAADYDKKKSESSKEPL
jgi:hypothetical protein